MRQIKIDASAQGQLEDIFGYTARRWNYEQASSYTDAIFATIEAIAADRVPWRSIPASFGIDGFVHTFGSHKIYWRCGTDDVIRIVAILHERMHQSSRLRDALDGEP